MDDNGCMSIIYACGLNEFHSAYRHELQLTPALICPFSKWKQELINLKVFVEPFRDNLLLLSRKVYKPCPNRFLLCNSLFCNYFKIWNLYWTFLTTSIISISQYIVRVVFKKVAQRSEIWGSKRPCNRSTASRYSGANLTSIGRHFILKTENRIA